MRINYAWLECAQNDNKDEKCTSSSVNHVNDSVCFSWGKNEIQNNLIKWGWNNAEQN